MSIVFIGVFILFTAPIVWGFIVRGGSTDMKLAWEQTKRAYKERSWAKSTPAGQPPPIPDCQYGLTLKDGWYRGKRGETTVGLSQNREVFYVEPAPPISSDVEIAANRGLPKPPPPHWSSSLGDPAFERHFRPEGNEAVARAMLSVSVRETMKYLHSDSRAHNCGITVRDGRVHLRRDSVVYLRLSSRPNDDEHVERIINELVTLADQMNCSAGSIAGQLAANLKVETRDACKRGTLNSLLSINSEESRNLSRPFMHHHDPWIRCRVAATFSDHGLETLCALAQNNGGEVDEEVRVMAIQALKAHHCAQTVELLRGIVGDESPVIRHAAALVLVALGEGSDLEQRRGGVAIVEDVGVSGGLSIVEGE